MELEMHPHQWERRAPDWPAAIVSGLVAGAVLMVMDLIWSSIMSSGDTWRSSHLISAIVLGPSALQDNAFNMGVVAVALVTHYALGVVFALCLAFIVAGFHYESSVPMIETIGAMFGIGVYVISMHGWSHVFPWITELRGWATLIGHMVFGMTAALTYWKLAQRGRVAG